MTIVRTGTAVVVFGGWHGVVTRTQGDDTIVRFHLFGKIIEAPVSNDNIIVLPHHIEPTWYRTAVVGQFV